MQSRTTTIVNTLTFFVVAACFGCMEGSGLIRWGPPNLFGLLHAQWHLPMATVMVLTAWKNGCFVHVPGWIWFEDVAYWVFSQFIWDSPELAKSSWISMGLSGVTVEGLYLPWTYFLLLVLWGLFILARLAYRSYKLKFD